MRLRHVAPLALLLLTSVFPASLLSAPPDVPGKLPAKVGKPLTFDVRIPPGKKFGFAPGFDRAKCAVVRLFSDDPTTASFLVIPDVAGEFYLTFWTEGEVAFSQTVIVAGGGTTPIDPPVKPPVDPPAPTTSLYFLIVRPDGPASPTFTNLIGLSEWETLKAKGHKYKDKTLTEAVALGVKIPTGTTLPCVVILRPRADGKTSEQITIAAAPTTGAGVLALPELVK